MITKAFGIGIAASIMLDLMTDLTTGAINGLVAGLVIGAIVVPIVHIPDAMGRALLIGILFGIGMAGYQIFQVLSMTGASFGEILNGLDNPVVGQAILNAALYILYAVLSGCLLGVIFTAPDWVLKGGLVGLAVGAVIGAALYWLLGYLRINLNINLFRVLVGLLIFGVIAAVVGDK
ncbi:MAG: hypothetical protein CSA11_06315 [Chloroflexi bacterium]|nr:MAG: hypothetical protein CSB13_02400 [Chloroflexota bacterium]PIE80836.1 MAG: hypothetical protein CSA11_06315 [Chloroflexota bacterium]